MTRRTRRMVVVGGSVAGVSAVEGVREAGFEDEVVLIGAERHLPYDRPPLSKRFLLGDGDAAALALRPAARFEQLRVELRLGAAAAALDTAARTLHLEDGDSIRYDGLVIATGASPRVPAFVRPMEQVHVLRTLEDAIALRSSLVSGSRLVVVGAGFIGSEVAASARALGCEVTVLEALGSPMSQALGPSVGGRLGRLHEDNGTRLMCGARVSALTGSDCLDGVRLDDGTTIAAEAVVIGVGVGPATAWLTDSGIGLADGVVCDEFCQAAPSVHVAGDAARWPHEAMGQVRVEHWTNAVEQGRHAALNAVAALRSDAQQPYRPVPSFWSDQYGHRINFAGWASPEPQLLDLDGGRVVVLYARGAVLCGALTLDAPRLLALLRPLVAAQASVTEALELVAAQRGAPPAPVPEGLAGRLAG